MLAKRSIALLALLLAVLCLFGCDRIGDLNERETEAFYAEIKEDINAGEMWDMETVFFHEDREQTDNVAFLKAGVETVLQNESLFTSQNAAWYSRKNWCKVYLIQCQIPFQYGETDYVIDSFEIAKYYYNGGYKMWLNYHKDSDEATADYIEVVFQKEEDIRIIKQNND